MAFVNDPQTWGRRTITTNPAGQAFVSHGVGGVPTRVLAQLESITYECITTNYNFTTFTVTVFNRFTGAAAPTGVQLTLVWDARA